MTRRASADQRIDPQRRKIMKRKILSADDADGRESKRDRRREHKKRIDPQMTQVDTDEEPENL
jgi:hypothetical protein